jgi:hypothetical protein
MNVTMANCKSAANGGWLIALLVLMAHLIVTTIGIVAHRGHESPRHADPLGHAPEVRRE